LAVRQLVDVCHRIAVAYLRQKMRRGRLQPERFGLSLEDLALDCFADLFQRDDTARFEVLANYFRTIGVEQTSEEVLAIILRRLIFSKVNEGLFRRYREADASLAKIIRNVKNAVRTVSGIWLIKREGNLWLVAGQDRSIEALPLAPPELLESFLIMSVSDSPQVNRAVSAFRDFVAVHPGYSNGYPLTMFSQALRAAFWRLGLADEHDSHRDEETFLPKEVERAISVATGEVKANMYKSYVEKGKVDAHTFDAYFRAVEDILAAQFVSGARPVTSYYVALQGYLPGLGKNSYHVAHRNIVEYLTKLARAHLIRYLASN
jgi:hypothetical protein